MSFNEDFRKYLNDTPEMPENICDEVIDSCSRRNSSKRILFAAAAAVFLIAGIYVFSSLNTEQFNNEVTEDRLDYENEAKKEIELIQSYFSGEMSYYDSSYTLSSALPDF